MPLPGDRMTSKGLGIRREYLPAVREGIAMCCPVLRAAFIRVLPGGKQRSGQNSHAAKQGHVRIALRGQFTRAVAGFSRNRSHAQRFASLHSAQMFCAQPQHSTCCGIGLACSQV